MNIPQQVNWNKKEKNKMEKNVGKKEKKPNDGF